MRKKIYLFSLLFNFLFLLSFSSVACDHTVVVYDSYGDGWNGAVMNVYVDGILVTAVDENGMEVTDIVCPDDPAGNIPHPFTFQADNGSVITIVFPSTGTWPSEIYYHIFGITGETLLENGNSDGISESDNILGFCPEGDMEYLSSTAFLADTLIVNPGSLNKAIIGLEIISGVGIDNPFNLTSLNFNTDGSSDAIIDIANAKVYCTFTDSTFSTDSLYGNFENPNGDFTVNGEILLNYGKNYFWLAYDISQDATLNNFVDAECTSFVISETTETPEVTAPAGNREISSDVYLLSGISELTTCDVMVYDEGGPNGNYENNFDGTITFYPNADLSYIQVEVISLTIGNNEDYLKIYDGNSTDAPLVANLTGTLNDTTFIASNDGSMTIQFTTNIAGIFDGFVLHVTCYEPTEAPAIAVNPLPFDGSEVGALDVAGTLMSWDNVPYSLAYYINFGTDNPPTNILNNEDLGFTNSYTPELDFLQTYYWQIIPYNNIGSTEDCPVWSFSTSSDVPVADINLNLADFGTSTIYPPAVSDTIFNFTLTNVGIGELTIESITDLEGTPFSTNLGLGSDTISLASNETSMPFVFAFQPTEDGYFETEFTIITSGGEITVTLSGSGYVLPSGMVEVGTGDLVNQYLPMEPYYGYSYSQSIYLQHEIKEEGRIERIYYHYNGDQEWGPDAIKVYMGHTTLTGLDDWVSIDDLTEVHEGELSVEAVDGWVEIVLTTPFEYNNVDNLVVAFEENTTGYHGYNSDFFCTAVDTNMSIYYYNDVTNPEPDAPPAGTLIESRPNIRFLFAPIPTGPAITFSPMELDFDEIVAAGDSVTTTFTVINNGVENLDISGIDIDGPFVINFDGEISIEAGESYVFEIEFFPTSSGVFTGTVTFTTNATTGDGVITLIASAYPSTYIGESFEEEFPPLGWSIENLSEGNDWTQYSYGGLEGNYSAQLYYNNINFSEGRLITPMLELNTVDEIDDFVSFYAKSNSTDAIIKVEYSYDGVNFIEIDEINLEPNYTQYVIDLSNITTVEDQGIFIAFHGITTIDYNTTIFMDVVLYPPIFLEPIPPGTTDNPIPEDETSELNVLSLNLGWDGIFEATGYYVNVGTDNPPTNFIQNESVEENSFNLNNLEYSTTYYWQIVPYNTFGSAEDCPVWSFTTMEALPPGDVQIGFDEITTQPLPMNCYYGYTYSQSIYTSEELINDVEGTARIEKISYYYNGNSAFGPDAIQIYMGHTNLSNFENDSWIISDNLSLVYDGEISVTSEEGWVDIILSTPFTYNGTDNLVVGFDENTPGYHSSADDFYSSITDSITSLYYFSDGTNPDPINITGTTSTPVTYRPNTKFHFGALPTGSVVMFSSSNLSFSTIPAETEDSIQISIFNTGISDLVINSLDINPPFYSNYSGTVVPGGSDIANIYFQPTEAGMFTDTLWSNSNTSTIETFSVLSGASYPSNYVGESFENEFHPEGWNIQNNGINQWTQNSAEAYEGDKCARLSYSYNGNSISNLITPQLVITNNDFITFQAKKNSANYGSLIITYSEDNINFTNLDTINLSSSYESFTVSFENIPEGNYYIGFLGDLSNSYNYLLLDAVIYPPIYIPPYPPVFSTEPSPFDGAADLSIFTINMSWDNNFFATACKINFGTDQSTFTEDSAEDLGDIENYQVTSLEYATTYYWQILPYNDYGTAEECPVWSFTTMADPTITSLPWLEDFQEPEGWLTQGTFNWTLYVPAGGDDNVQGIRALYPAYSGGNAEVISPPVVLDVDAELVFKWSHGYTTNNPTTQMQVSASTDGLDWDVIWDKEGEDFDSEDGASSYAPGDYVNAVVSLANYNGQTVYVKFDAISEYGGYPVFVDSVEIKESVDMELISTTTTQTNTDYIFAGYDNQEIIAVEITTEGNANPFEITEFEFNTIGSTDAGNDITNAKVYYTVTDDDFEAINEFGSVNNPNGDFTITGTQILAGEGINYFWLVYGISENATLENIVDAQCNYVKIDGTNQDTEISIPDGDREIHIAPDTIIMGTTTDINTCFAYFYDNGGIENSYTSSSTETLVIYPDGADAKVKINFSVFNTYFSDDLIIYDGNSNSAPLIGEYSGSTIPEEIISSANDGSLTLEFSPTGNSNVGWEAVVSCHYMIPDLEISVNSITFEDTYENIAAPSHEIFIRNDGAANLTVASHQINGDDASMFSVSATYPMEIIPGDSVAVYVSFTPTSYGDKIAGVLFTDVTGEYTDLALLYGHCIDPTLTPSFTETFTESVPAAGWQSYEGELTENSNLTIVPVGWFSADFANDNAHENGASAKREPYFEENYWLITPPIELGTQGFDLHFDIALTTHNASEESSIDVNGKFAVVISTDNGDTWSSDNILQEWNNSNTISNVGESVSISLADYSGTVRLAFYSELTQIASDGYDIFVDNITVGTPCDLNIDLGDNVNMLASDLPYTVSIEDNYASYQWFNNGVAMEGETNSSYEITTAGLYELTLEVTDENDCQASDDINIDVAVGMESLKNTKISIYPNPNAGIFNLEINSDVKEFSFELTNMKGQVIYNKIVKSSNYKEVIDISDLEKGIYYIKVINANSVKTEKLIIK